MCIVDDNYETRAWLRHWIVPGIPTAFEGAEGIEGQWMLLQERTPEADWKRVLPSGKKVREVLLFWLMDGVVTLTEDRKFLRRHPWRGDHEPGCGQEYCFCGPETDAPPSFKG